MGDGAPVIQECAVKTVDSRLVRECCTVFSPRSSTRSTLNTPCPATVRMLLSPPGLNLTYKNLFPHQLLSHQEAQGWFVGLRRLKPSRTQDQYSCWTADCSTMLQR